MPDSRSGLGTRKTTAITKRNDPQKDIPASIAAHQNNKFRKEFVGEASMGFLLEQQDDGEHFYSPKVADRIERDFKTENKKDAKMSPTTMNALMRHY
jgi:hypothetical protein